MKYEDSLYCVMERAMSRMTSAEDITTLLNRRNEAIEEFETFCQHSVVRGAMGINYITWLNMTYLMLRQYLL